MSGATGSAVHPTAAKMSPMAESRARIPIAITGALLMAGCAILSLKTTELIADAWPDGHLLGRLWLLYCFAPLTMAGTLLSAVWWTRRFRASARDAAGALLVAEVLAWGVVAQFYGAWFGAYVFAFWAAANVVFAPSWVVGFWLARGTEHKGQGTH